MKVGCINCGYTWDFAETGLYPSCFPEWKRSNELRWHKRTESAFMLGEFGQPLWDKPVSKEVTVLQQKWVKGKEEEWRDI
jgi:hypothetical protein